VLTTVRCHYSSDTSALRPRSFRVSGPASWNAVPPRLRDPYVSCESLSQLLKTELSFLLIDLCHCHTCLCDSFLLRVEFEFLVIQADHLSGKKGNVGILLKIRELFGKKILLGKSCLKLFIVNCIFVTIQVFSRSLLCLSIWFWIMYCCIPTPTLERA